jgi:Tfp pilus assembly protein PilF
MQTAGQAQQTNLTPQQAMARAEQLFRSGQLNQSEALCRRILAAQPRFHPAYYQLALIAVEVGKLPLAAELIGKAIALDASVASYHKAVGEIYRRLGRPQPAIAAGMQSVKLAPRDADAFYNLGLALADGGRMDEAAAQYRRALACDPRYGLAANNLGTVLEKLGDVGQAKKYYALAIEVNPRHAEAQNNLGAILSADGDLDRARACFGAAIDANPSFIHAHYNLSTLKKYKADDPHLAAMEAMKADAPKMDSETRLRFWFAIAKAWEDIGRYDEAFDAYSRGNRLKRATFQYNVNTTKASCDDIIGKFDAAFFAKHCGGGYADETPVFIVGMPRSGTTLIEQIISSHTGIFGAGELKDFCEVVSEKSGKPAGASYMDMLAGGDADFSAGIGKAYVERIRRLNATAPRITDKMPGNFFYVGLIHLALPNAKIIYSQREPLDICFSNYSRLFNETMPFAYDLQELARYYNCCRRVMAHWKKILPAGTILDFKYEDVVEDLDTQARRLIEFCGLEWQDACLEFHKNDRPVKTASIAQVRTPIYKSSVARWEHFRNHLEPLRAIIEQEEI